MNDRDHELISAYIDNALNAAERDAFQRRLADEPDLQREVDSLRQTVALLRQLPDRKAPRNFTLDRSMLPERKTLPFALTTTFSALSAAAAALLFFFGAYFLSQGNLVPSPAQPIMIQQQAPAVAELPTATTTAAPTRAAMPAMPATQPPTQEPSEQVEALEAEVDDEAAASGLAQPPADEAQEEGDGMLFLYQEDAAEPAEDAPGGTGAASDTAAIQMSTPTFAAETTATPVDDNLNAQATGLAFDAVPIITDAALPATVQANLMQRAAPTEIALQIEPPAASAIAEADQFRDMDTMDDTAVTEAPPVPEAVPAESISIFGVGLLVLGVLLTVIAVGSTIARRRHCL
ncbi:MAG: hypothetical protein CL610_17655 [Anaerolineaceae bacterium]|nr:hypothetical protein [Anaerolineaceae bacterium]